MSITLLIVQKLGGFWAVRQRFKEARTPLARRWWGALHGRYLLKHAAFIGLGAEFATPPTFPHGPFGVFISQNAVLGRDCVIFQNVTIGSNNLHHSRTRGAPSLGDGCMLGAGAAVIGAVTLGDNVRVGANAVVAKDVPSNAVVVNAPVRVIQKESLDNRFVAVEA